MSRERSPTISRSVSRTGDVCHSRLTGESRATILRYARWMGNQGWFAVDFKQLLLQFSGPVLHENQWLVLFFQVGTVD